MKIFIFIFFVFITSGLVSATLLIDDSFETGRYNSSIWINQTCSTCSHAMNFINPNSVVTQKDGNYIMRVNLSSNDSFTAGGSRSELSHYAINTTQQTEYWYGFSLYIPLDWQNETKQVWNIFAQWHAQPERGELSTSPPLALELDNNTLRIYSRNTSVFNITNTSQITTTTYVLSNLLKGQWDNYVFNVKWSSGSDGFLNVWRNNVLVLNKTGPNTYNDTVAPYWKLGIYRDNTSVSPRVVYFDNIKMGDNTSSYAEVDSNPEISSNESLLGFASNSKINLGSGGTINLK